MIFLIYDLHIKVVFHTCTMALETQFKDRDKARKETVYGNIVRPSNYTSKTMT